MTTRIPHLPTAHKDRRIRPLTFPELFALPVTVDLITAANAIGISVTTAYKLVHRDAFPCAVMRTGHAYRIPTMALIRALGIERMPVLPEDVERGAEFAARFEE